LQNKSDLFAQIETHKIFFYIGLCTYNKSY